MDINQAQISANLEENKAVQQPKGTQIAQEASMSFQPVYSSQPAAAVAKKKKVPLWVLYTPFVLVNVILVILFVVFIVKLTAVLS